MDNKESSIGTTIGSIVVIIIIIVGGLYFWGKSASTVKSPAAPKLPAINAQYATDTIDNISNDLKGIDVNNLDKGIIDINGALK